MWTIFDTQIPENLTNHIPSPVLLIGFLLSLTLSKILTWMKRLENALTSSFPRFHHHVAIVMQGDICSKFVLGILNASWHLLWTVIVLEIFDFPICQGKCGLVHPLQCNSALYGIFMIWLHHCTELYQPQHSQREHFTCDFNLSVRENHFVSVLFDYLYICNELFPKTYTVSRV